MNIIKDGDAKITEDLHFLFPESGVEGKISVDKTWSIWKEV